MDQCSALFRRQADRFRVLGFRLRIVNQCGLGEYFAAGHGGGEACHLQWGDQDVALPDRGVGRIAGHPFAIPLSLFPRRVGNDHTALFIGQLDPGRPVEPEAPALGGQHAGGHEFSGFIVVDVAAHRDRITQQDVAMVTMADIAGVGAVADHVVAVAKNDGLVGPEGAVAEARDRRQDLEGRTRGVKSIKGQIRPRSLFIHLGHDLGAGARRELVEIEIRFAGEHEHLAGGDVECDRGACLVAQRRLGLDLQVDVE